MNLIIGVNSKLYKLISKHLDNHFAISHVDIYKTDFNIYEKIYLFSWSNADDTFVGYLLENLPSNKFVFISTAAVYSLDVRNQWNLYPYLKASCEREVRRIGGMIIRIGLLEDDADRMGGWRPVSTAKRIVYAMNSISRGIEIDAFEWEYSQLRFGHKIQVMIHGCTKYLPNIKFFRVGFEALTKLFGGLHYGYTQDMLEYFKPTVQVGYGAIGSSLARYVKPDLYIISDDADVHLNESGFRNTIIGYNKIGLAKYWHSVYVEERNGSLVKKVPFFVKRSSPPSNKLLGKVVGINFDSKYAEILIKNHDNIVKRRIANKVYLAAGAISNAQIVSQLINTAVTLSDHEILLSGKILTSEAIEKKLVKPLFFGFLVAPMQMFKNSTACGVEFLIDSRPYVKSRYGVDQAFYNTNACGIIRKLLKSFSISRINEAIYNKFSFGIKTKFQSIFVQILNNDCITVNGSELRRTRVSESTLRYIQQILDQSYSSFEPSQVLETFDSQHIQGGASVYSNVTLNKLINSGRLRILGSPTKMPLDVYHHTRSLIDYVKSSEGII